ncbi:MAG TPA: ADP-ribosylglycohydrolase family protein, partial [Candidatus Limiplasma sp.]|nr:ADP-ribosylglycohydrolase family protein [Candidatus Limiplasma sp.]
MIPGDYLSKVYAGFLGMNIGIRLGAPVESGFWTYERLRDVYGDIRGYVRDYKHFAADDDTNGPVFFARALEDGGGEPTAQTVAETWLNYAREGVGLYWWGGFGVSTEHTAYLNLKNGIPAPRSGSIAQNGKTAAEQIGGQIFIDTWGLMAPCDPARAPGEERQPSPPAHVRHLVDRHRGVLRRGTHVGTPDEPRDDRVLAVVGRAPLGRRLLRGVRDG